MPPSTRWARIAASLRPARPGRAAAWRPPSFRPSERNRPAPKTTRSTIWTWSDIWPSGTSTRRRWDMSADPMSSRRSLRRRPGNRLGGRRLSAWSGPHVGDHARPRRRARHCVTGGHGLPVASQSALVQWYVETSGSPSEATSWLNTAHQAVRAYSVGGYVNYLEVNQPPARYFGPNLSRLSAVRQKYDPSRVMFSGLNF